MQTIFSQTTDNLKILLIVEIGDDAFGHDLTNPLYLLQFFQTRVHQGIDIFEMPCQQLSRSLSHKTDAEGEDHPFKGNFLGGGDAIDNLLGRLRAAAITIDLLDIDIVEVGHIVDQSLTVVVVDGFWS